MNSDHMSHLKFTIETCLYTLIFALALLLRLYNLGATPLSDDEAKWALQALKAADPSSEIPGVEIGPQPGYVFLTGSVFDLFGESNFLARFWPALAGAFLALLPVFFRREVGSLAALIAAIGLAIDPGLVTVSRQAGGPMMALAFSLLGLGLWHIHRIDTRLPVLVGISAGLAILSGPALLSGISGLLLVYIITRFINRIRAANKDASQDLTVEKPPDHKEIPSIPADMRMVMISTGLTVLLVGTSLFQHPEGLAAWFQMLPAYLAGWLPSTALNSSPVLGTQLIFALLVYQPLALLLTLIGIVRRLFHQSLDEESGEHLPFFLFLWVIASFLLNLLYPGRQVNDLVWTLIPLWMLAAISLVGFLPRGKPNLISLLQAGLILVLSSLFWNTLIASNQITAGTAWQTIGLRLGILIGIISLGGLTTVLVSLGWSWETSRNGLVWGLTVALVVYSISSMWGASQLRANLPNEFWSRPPAPSQVELLTSTLQDLSRWKTGFSQQIDAISTIDAPSLLWVLRDYPNIHIEPGLPTGTLPSVIITRQEQEAPALTATYRGQDFVWWVRPGWSSAVPPNITEWLTFRAAPLENEKLILWARSDLFPGGTFGSGINSDESP